MGGTLNVNGTQTGAASAPSGRVVGAFGITMGECDEVTTFALTDGANDVTIPGGAIGCIITPPLSGGATLILKGVTGDTGIEISNTVQTMLTFGSSATAFVITASEAVASPDIEIAYF